MASVTTSGTVNYLTTISVLPNANNCAGGNDNDNGDAIVRRRAQSGVPPPVTCGSVEWMAPGPDGNLWFTDDNGYIGNITPAGVATEWDISQLANFNGQYFPEPGQFTFGPDGNIYVGDYDNLMDEITVSGSVPISASSVSGSCQSGGTYGIAIDAANTFWAGDYCSNLYAVPLGNPINASNFNQSNLQSWSVAPLTNNNSLGEFASTPGGVYAIDFESTTVYRINEVTGTSPPQPAITTFSQFSSNFTTEALALGPDTNLWAGFTSGDETIQSVARVAFGAPAIGTQSLLRNLPRATASAARNAGILAKRRPHRSRRL